MITRGGYSKYYEEGYSNDYEEGYSNDYERKVIFNDYEGTGGYSNDNKGRLIK